MLRFKSLVGGEPSTVRWPDWKGPRPAKQSSKVVLPDPEGPWFILYYVAENDVEGQIDIVMHICKCERNDTRPQNRMVHSCIYIQVPLVTCSYRDTNIYIKNLNVFILTITAVSSPLFACPLTFESNSFSTPASGVELRMKPPWACVTLITLVSREKSIS